MKYIANINIIELSGLPIALLHRYTLYGKSPVRQHLFFTICGLLICYWNYGNYFVFKTGYFPNSFRKFRTSFTASLTFREPAFLNKNIGFQFPKIYIYIYIYMYNIYFAQN